ncbi:hypothetical protein [Prevotella sp. KH2C16]|uniref:hypothetical protein n=1 Tax=Prevotella sp. KH2C16 TaxID=1855325 RepID=UPI0008F02E1E|nr:hypothetical protein [Prevotella sp. KH2C16]SFG37977.1 hypothetical protein SAMN05216383_1122 [Prevotella sp. KH2C16]SFG75723.1 hypothetical protein SAMN05216383_13920 [Prevotella sp. KH2C16]
MAKVSELEIKNPSELPVADSISGVTLPFVQGERIVVAGAEEFVNECKKPVNTFLQEKSTEFNKNLDAVKKPVVQVSSTTVNLLPNKFYRFSIPETGGAYTLTLQAPTDTANTNDYEGGFDTGATAPTITFPADVNWGEADMSIVANTHYEFSIRYDAVSKKYYGMIYSWAL